MNYAKRLIRKMGLQIVNLWLSPTEKTPLCLCLLSIPFAYSMRNVKYYNIQSCQTNDFFSLISRIFIFKRDGSNIRRTSRGRVSFLS